VHEEDVLVLPEEALADLVAAGGEAEQVVALEKRLAPPNTLESRASG
jgi:hypothetical protein